MDVIDGRRLRGDESRRTVLERAMDVASVHGLGGLSLGTLAADVGASKSGVAALFGSKERLQVAVVQAAREVFLETVIEPARSQPRGLPRLAALVMRWLAYSQNRVFTGGCFFLAAATEFDSKPGVIRDAIAEQLDEWDGYLVATIGYAMRQGELPLLDDAEQLAFELRALEEQANSRSLLRGGGDEPYRRARRATTDRLLSLGADPTVLEASGLVPAPAG
ncbi:TetR/AcrR family transcriptional regulator [Cryobacterium sp. BB307]|uniref:TetR/AcrR family transcriptional regulator n=1 Tax=Cryobacterium sp. BB307 TaxID=2716317 RepID=UPI0014470480|nr:TetR/AcrR family transcriptional regulator [Cryobacterium sp. BB307]